MSELAPSDSQRQPENSNLTSTGRLVCSTANLLEPGETTEFWLTRSVETLGSGNGCSVQIKSAELSPLHARVTATANVWMIEAGIGNPGVWINDAAVEGPTELKAGDVLRFGKLSFRFEVLDMAPSEFAVMPDKPPVSQGPKVRLAETLQLELSPDGVLVEVNKTAAGTAQSAAPADKKGPSQSAETPAKVKASVGVGSGLAKPREGRDNTLESALKILDDALPAVIQLLVSEALKGNVEAACACLNFASRSRTSRGG